MAATGRKRQRRTLGIETVLAVFLVHGRAEGPTKSVPSGTRSQPRYVTQWGLGLAPTSGKRANVNTLASLAARANSPLPNLYSA